MKFHHLITLTFRLPRSTHAAKRQYVAFVQRLNELLNSPVRWFAVFERNRAGHAHVHALVWGTEHLPVDEIQGCFGAGFSRVTVVDPEGAAVEYCCKSLKGDFAEWEFSEILPPEGGSVGDTSSGSTGASLR